MCDLRMRDIPYPIHPLKGHASRIGYKIMGLFSDEKRTLSTYVSGKDFTSGVTSVINPNGVEIADDVPAGHGHHHGRPHDKPRLHSEIAALQNVSNSLDPNFTLNHTDAVLRATSDYSILCKNLQAIKEGNKNIPLRVKFYIKNSAYPPCKTEYSPSSQRQTGASCDRYLKTFIRNFKQRYGVDARMKVASPGEIIGRFGRTTNTRVRYGYPEDKIILSDDFDLDAETGTIIDIQKNGSRGKGNFKGVMKLW